MDFNSSLLHNHAYHIASKEDLLNLFSEKDQAQVLLPKDVPFPIDVPYYFTWSEPSGNYTYLAFKRPNWELPRGLVFRRTREAPVRPNACDWCHSYGSSDEIGMMTVSVNSKVTVGQYLCMDLSCLTKLESQVGAAGKNFDTLAEQLCDKIARFYERTIMAPKGS